MSDVFKKNGNGRTWLKKASRDPIGSYFQTLPPADRQQWWLSTINRYRVACTKQYDDDLPKAAKPPAPAKPSTVDHAALISYIAASGPCHVIDGWSFLGRAIDAMLRGDSYAAVHLGYYAELRAAMALLACEGVGIFNTKHASVDRKSTTHSINSKGTHKFIWPCLQYWSGLTRARTLVDGSFRPATRPLSTWLTALGGKISARVIATRWLRTWGIDLYMYEEDRDARNLVSYRPLELRRPAATDAQLLSVFVEDLWKCFEPSEGNRFPVIEKYLLRRALVAGGVTFPLTDASLTAVGMGATEAASWLPVLNDTSEPSFISEAEGQSAVEDPKCHLQVVSRAALLLYLATSAARRHLATAGYTRQDLAFWWRSHGINRGLWDDASQPANPLDLWADILDILQQNRDFIAGNAGGLSLNSWRIGQSRAIDFMGAYELVAIWGLLP